MLMIDLQHFKTKKCNAKHQELNYSSSHFGCEMYHSKYDKRRNPFLENKRELLYGDIYIQDFYSTQMASNFVEYLYHPNIYKTIACKFRDNCNYQVGVQNVGKCPYSYCPYLHENEDVSSLSKYRNLAVNNNPQAVSHQLTITSEVVKMLKLPKKQFESNFKSEISLVKEKLKGIDRQVLKQQPLKILPPKIPLIQDIHKKLKQNIKSNDIFQSWYIPYQQFYFGQKLPIIEDRHHQFKNFRDIINNSITPIVMKYITAFLNSQGGVLYIGIDDASVVLGFQINQSQLDKFLLSIDKEGRFNMYPPLMPQKYSIRRIPVLPHKKSKELWVLQVKVTPLQRDKKNKMLHTYNRDCFMRMISSTHKLDAMDLFEYIRLNEQQKPQSKNKKEQLEILLKSFDNKPKMLEIQSQELIQMKQTIIKMGEKIDNILIDKKKK